MRLWLLLLLVPAVHGALLTDPAGDVAISHCEQASTPAEGFDAMDLLTVEVNETPDHLVVSVTAKGLQEEAEHDSGNYFVHLRRGDVYYALRMFQDNAGKGAIGHLIQSEGISFFGPIIAEIPADVDGDENRISTAIPRDLLIDHDGAVPIRGHHATDIIASAQAHATGIYACSLDGSGGGPAIIRDAAPDSFDPADGGSVTFRFGGGESEGPIMLSVERPFRASNGQATTYAFNITVANTGEQTTAYTVTAEGLPDDWAFLRPNGTLVLGANSETTFTAYTKVPFQHVHGATSTFDVVINAEDGTASASAQVGVHYLAVPQPSGHHPEVFIHSVVPLGIDQTHNEAAGAGGNHMFWNTLEQDDSDAGEPMSNQLVDGDLVWYGCLAPRLAMGLAPANETGTYEFSFQTDVEMTGTVSGAVHLVAPAERGATCQDARDWEPEQTLLELRPQPFGSTVAGTINVTFDESIPFRKGTDLLLEIRLQTYDPIIMGGRVDLMPGGRMVLPLEDHHDAVPEVVLPASPETGFVQEKTPEKQSPALGIAVMLGVVLMARRHARTAYARNS